MNIKNYIKTTTVAAVAVLLLAANASAITITYSTDVGTAFGVGGLALNQTSGAAASLTYTPNVNSITGIPSNVNFGEFSLVCANCTTQGAVGAVGAFFNPFTFNLNITDVTDGNAKGTFVGTSTGGAVYSDLSGITITWAPLVLGPGLNNASSGNFGQTSFTTTGFTGIPAPNSGLALPGGVATVQGFVNSSAVPEPATFGLVGAVLLGLGVLRRKSAKA